MRSGLASSLVWRVMLRTLAVTLIALAVIGGAVAYRFVDSLSVLSEVSLRDQALDIRRHLVVRGDRIEVRLPDDLAQVYDSGDLLYAILSEKGVLLAASSGLHSPLSAVAAERSDDDDPTYFSSVDGRPGERVTGLSMEYEVDDEELIIQVAQGPHHADALTDSLIEDFFAGTAWIVPAVAAIICLVTVLTIHLSFRPLAALSRRAAAVGPASTDVRLSTEEVPSEVRPLVDAVNRAFDRLHDGFRLQRQFTADAAHELRTPLAVLRANAETVEDPEASRRLMADVDRMSRIVDQLLGMARLDALEVDRTQRADLRQVALTVAGDLGPLALSQGKSLALDGDDPAWVAASADSLEHAVRNLVDNALRHGTQVEILVRATPEPTLVVQDDGPGIPAADREKLFDRFWRGDRRRSDGAGLGLAIVKQVAELHGGTVAVDDGPAGGARLTLRFPAVST